ncbi:MAG: TetR/AcrR family transcriptional regulator [Caulobacteraceae bacterium]|nr:TetR/AcrR family transcriptional regulator [Caulobacteraceae bacterium]
MTTTANTAPRPYHHGDLRRALLDAAITIIERDGANAMTLRAVAREAGVSPAAPYHHFKDKGDLLHDVAKEGFRQLYQAMAAASDPQSRSIAYVEFAHEHPALYRVMYDCARNMERLPTSVEVLDASAQLMRQALIDASAGDMHELDLALTAIAAWSAAHGLAEMSLFSQFQPLKDAMGGERPFLKALFDRLLCTRANGEAPPSA